jgi:hypothetical protein
MADHRAEILDRITTLLDDLVQEHNEMECDIIGVISHVLLETTLFNLSNKQILSWFPDEFLTEALIFLQDTQHEVEAELSEQEDL